MSQMELFDAAAVYDPAYENPMVVMLGKGPQLTRCKTCAHFLRVPYQGKEYLKCGLRGVTHGAGTDHRANWLACAWYKSE